MYHIFWNIKNKISLVPQNLLHLVSSFSSFQIQVTVTPKTITITEDLISKQMHFLLSNILTSMVKVNRWIATTCSPIFYFTLCFSSECGSKITTSFSPLSLKNKFCCNSPHLLLHGSSFLFFHWKVILNEWNIMSSLESSNGLIAPKPLLVKQSYTFSPVVYL